VKNVYIVGVRAYTGDAFDSSRSTDVVINLGADRAADRGRLAVYSYCAVEPSWGQNLRFSGVCATDMKTDSRYCN
jgi:hypothetical protein